MLELDVDGLAGLDLVPVVSLLGEDLFLVRRGHGHLLVGDRVLERLEHAPRLGLAHVLPLPRHIVHHELLNHRQRPRIYPTLVFINRSLLFLLFRFGWRSKKFVDYHDADKGANK